MPTSASAVVGPPPSMPPVANSERTPVIIDCHGHYTTTPPAVGEWRETQKAAVASDPNHVGSKSEILVSDDEIRESLEGAQLALQRERGTDLTIFSPRASWMGHHIGNEHTSKVLVPAPERADTASVRPVPLQLRPGRPAAAVSGSAHRRLSVRVAALHRRDGLHRMQRQPRPQRRALERAAASGPLLVAAVGGDVRARRGRHDPCERVLQRELPHHRLALSGCRHDCVHAGADVGVPC